MIVAPNSNFYGLWSCGVFLGVQKTLPQNLSLVACQCFTAGPIRMMRKPLARRRPDSMPTCLLLVVGFQPIWKICVKQVNKPYMDPISLFLLVKFDFFPKFWDENNPKEIRNHHPATSDNIHTSRILKKTSTVSMQFLTIKLPPHQGTRSEKRTKNVKGGSHLLFLEGLCI